jgi:hypothetical protein
MTWKFGGPMFDSHRHNVSVNGQIVYGGDIEVSLNEGVLIFLPPVHITSALEIGMLIAFTLIGPTITKCRPQVSAHCHLFISFHPSLRVLSTLNHFTNPSHSNFLLPWPFHVLFSVFVFDPFLIAFKFSIQPFVSLWHFLYFILNF